MQTKLISTGVAVGGVRYKARGRDRGDGFRIFKIKFEFGVARTWENVVRLCALA